MNKRKKVTRIVLVCLLALGFCFSTYLAFHYSAQYHSERRAFADWKDSDIFVTMTDLRKNAEKYGVSPEFMQSFFDDLIVYYGALGLTFAPVDEDIAFNSYDWEKLSLSGAFRSYDGSAPCIDVSQHQGEIDWMKVAAGGVKYAMIRVGYTGYATGEQVFDTCFEANIEGALQAGIEVGVYFYTQAVDVDEARAEAAFVIDAIKGYNVTLPVAIDVEPAPSDSARANGLDMDIQTEIVRAFCEQVKKAGYAPMIYANTPGFMESMFLYELQEYNIWLAQYYRLRPFFPYQFAMWQYTNQGSVDGIKGDVDVNVLLTVK